MISKRLYRFVFAITFMVTVLALGGCVVGPVGPYTEYPTYAEDYWYYPSVGVYYDNRLGYYHYNSGGNWVRTSVLPSYLYTGLGPYIVLSDPGPTPWYHYHEHRRYYPPERYRHYPSMPPPPKPKYGWDDRDWDHRPPPRGGKPPPPPGDYPMKLRDFKPPGRPDGDWPPPVGFNPTTPPVNKRPPKGSPPGPWDGSPFGGPANKPAVEQPPFGWSSPPSPGFRPGKPAPPSPPDAKPIPFPSQPAPISSIQPYGKPPGAGIGPAPVRPPGPDQERIERRPAKLPKPKEDEGAPPPWGSGGAGGPGQGSPPNLKDFGRRGFNQSFGD